MASIVIRNLDDDIKRKLRIRAALRNRSMEEEARNILCSALQEPADAGPANLAEHIRQIMNGKGVELELPSREPLREPPHFQV